MIPQGLLFQNNDNKKRPEYQADPFTADLFPEGTCCDHAMIISLDQHKTSLKRPGCFVELKTPEISIDSSHI